MASAAVGADVRRVPRRLQDEDSSVELAPDVVAVLAVTATAVGAVLLVVVVLLALRIRVLRRAQRRAFGGAERDILEVMGEQAAALAEVNRATRHLEARTDDLRERISHDLARFAVVRYDAFEDMGGALSFSAALLNEHGDGVVLSAINGRSETRSYAKGITAGRSEHSLSDEEAEAIEAAMSGQRSGDPQPNRRRRRKAS